MLKFINDYQSKIETVIEKYLQVQGHKKTIPLWGTDVPERLTFFALQGKMLRGALVVAGFSLSNKKPTTDVYTVAAAVELAHTALIIHDDIIDQDQLRRGGFSMHMQYEVMASERNVRAGEYYGESMALCVGDASLFLAYSLLGGLRLKNSLREEIISLFSKEFYQTTLAQMQDVDYSFSEEVQTSQEVIEMYRYKTARYTFSLPLMLGAIISEAPKKIITMLGKIGEMLGILYQLKDDELGIYGNSKEIGKAIGSDIKQGKKTILLLQLLNLVTTGEKKKLAFIIGNKTVTPKDILYIQRLMETYKVRESVAEIAKTFQQQVESDIKKLPHSPLSEVLHGLVTYTTERTK